MKYIFTFCLGLLFMVPTFAQSKTITPRDWTFSEHGWQLELSLKTSIPTAFQLHIPSATADFSLQLSLNGESFHLLADSHTNKEGWVSPLIHIDKSSKLTLTTEYFPPRELLIESFEQLSPIDITKKMIVDTSDCACLLPPIVTRESWCSGACPENSNAAQTTVTHFIVHHSAGVNTSSNWAQEVQNIWNAHVNGNGWADIGYNFLIDPEGTIYQGRGEDIRGAHFCGQNTATMGICMLGNYQDQQPTTESLESLERLLAWKACKSEIDPEDFNFHSGSGLNLFHISGHRDGCNTLCPGENLYTQLPTIRPNTTQVIEDGCEDPVVVAAGPVLKLDTLPSTIGMLLEWYAVQEDVLGFILEKSVGDSLSFSPFQEIPFYIESIIDPFIESDSLYCYRIQSYSYTDTSAISNIVCGSINIPLVTGTNFSKEEKPEDLFIGPNPFSNSLFLSSTNQDYKWLIHDAMGRKIWESDGKTRKVELSTVNWQSGVYFLTVQSDSQKWSSTLIRYSY